MPGRRRTLFDADAHWRFALEWLRVGQQFLQPRGRWAARRLLTETQLQLAVRYALGSAIR